MGGVEPEPEPELTPAAAATTNGNGHAHVAGDEEGDSPDGSSPAPGSKPTTTLRNGHHSPSSAEDYKVHETTKTNMSLDLKPTNPSSSAPGLVSSPVDSTIEKKDEAGKGPCLLFWDFG
jgi:hypothetical protein